MDNHGLRIISASSEFEEATHMDCFEDTSVASEAAQVTANMDVAPSVVSCKDGGGTRPSRLQ